MCSFFLINRIKHDIPRSHATGSQQRSITQSASRVKRGLFSIRLATAPGSWSVSCLTSIPRQKGKAVITNKLLLVKRSLTMQSDECVTPSWNGDNTITSSGLCASLGFSLTFPRTSPSSHLVSSLQTFLMKYKRQHFVQRYICLLRTPLQARTLLE